MRRLLPMLVALPLVGPGPAHAVSFDAGYAADRERDTGLATSGFTAGLSQGLSRHFYVGASYSQLRTEPFADGSLSGRLEYESAGFELGAGRALSLHTGLSASVGYAGSETRGLDGFADDPVQRAHGPMGSLTLSIQPNRRITLLAGPSYSYIGRVPGWQTTAGMRLRLSRALWLNTGYWSGKVAEGWNAGLSLGFGAD